MSSISVIIPCYRYGHYLQEAVSSVLDDQRGVDVLVLVIDDASPDESAEVAREIASRRAEVEVIVHDTNRGNIATFNEGLLEWADGHYCLRMSADDRATPGALARASALLDAYPEVGFVYGRALWVLDGALLPPARTKGRGWTVTPGQRLLEHRFRQAENPITSPEIVVRTSLHQRVGGYDPGLPKAADMEIYMRLAAHSDVGFLRGVDQAYYRLHPHNMRKAVTSLLDLRQRRSVFELVLSRYGERIVNASRLDDMVHRQLAREALWAAGRVYDRGSFANRRWGGDCWAAARTRTLTTLTGCCRSRWSAGRRQSGCGSIARSVRARGSAPSKSSICSTRRRSGGCAVGRGNTEGLGLSRKCRVPPELHSSLLST
jgi:glycosyltransferase involved in cell wall biosynthesis